MHGTDFKCCILYLFLSNVKKPVVTRPPIIIMFLEYFEFLTFLSLGSRIGKLTTLINIDIFTYFET